MSYEDCMTKIGQMSTLLENSKYPEEILNNKDINLEEDFQYLCLNSTINPELVNEVIARLAQNGNKELVEKNIKCITMEMWKELFSKNKATKELFMGNYFNILNNTGILTYREIEKIIADDDTIQLVYESMEIIIKKLCTYDRASLICNLKYKADGIEKIRENIEQFFKKGEYDISTTYSKVLYELGNVTEISKTEILEACTRYLSEMLERETAIDNETNDLLNWIYYAMEETQMSDEKRNTFQKRIDEAVLYNFEGILDRTNYDKETMRILKQFPCTHDKFDNNRNMFIEKSNKLIHMTKIYDLTYEKENKEKSIEDKASNVEINKSNPACTEEKGKDNFEEAKSADVKIDDNINSEQQIIDMLVKTNVKDTDKVIERIMNKCPSNRDNAETLEKCDQKEIAVTNCKEPIENKENVSENMALMMADQKIEVPKNQGFIKRIISGIKKLFRSLKAERYEI